MSAVSVTSGKIAKRARANWAAVPPLDETDPAERLNAYLRRRAQ